MTTRLYLEECGNKISIYLKDRTKNKETRKKYWQEKQGGRNKKEKTYKKQLIKLNYSQLLPPSIIKMARDARGRQRTELRQTSRAKNVRKKEKVRLSKKFQAISNPN